MQRMKIKELVAAAYACLPELPPEKAQLIRELATRLDVTFAALTESLDQRMSLDAEINQLRQEAK
ncbi:TPA: hypothetical protein ACJJYF_001002 [Enterobacter cloacae]|uniref:hypothetical protein n=1 Tax=Enterobacter cloacae TaxID=550 RepID=UPI0010A580A8|nr:hypothetical protein [Enterobacter cloacae]EKS6326564.1 hypothetical protein [Enterobacter hormaechei]MCK7380262.1 hypothetical protein [Enterobacter cloacae]QCC94444.1 hypothetical protein E7735_26300 [Enterobacter cloacae]QCC99646.1 hypothetical protein E7739_27155 [Enterobacter cloacae]QCD13955.1 hypothetical protein E7729_25770 [Enterobacter cloacae]